MSDHHQGSARMKKKSSARMKKKSNSPPRPLFYGEGLQIAPRSFQLQQKKRKPQNKEDFPLSIELRLVYKTRYPFIYSGISAHVSNHQALP